ncbi:alpha/beta fold hydrolase [Inhella proteolytica]|uniref:Alpha/beta fold hydrolase n=1 Tax=Inhella proteolytica TaxID=2795029 RepID=A0A931J6E8_9BURK|nr:alpha/beta fold hydrolase [Inhella proteolytica]MBH9577005.1 alpha/beta fold hydrolase [Inhella proteolytica]
MFLRLLRLLPLLLALGVQAEEAPLRFSLPGAAQGFDAGQYPAHWRFRRLAEPVFGSRILVLEAGDPQAQPLMLVHGLGQNGLRDWLGQIEPLAARYRVIALDLPGFGHSEPGQGRYSPTNFARLLAWLHTELGLAPGPVVGHSMGGAVALRYAASHPEQVTQLVLVDAAGILERSSFLKTPTTLPRELDGAPRLLRRLAHQAKDLGDSLVELSGLGADPTAWLSAHDGAWRLLLQDQPNTNAALALMEEDFSAAAHQLPRPTTLIWGERDRVAPLRTGQALLATLPQARLYTLPEAAHVPMADQPQAFQQLLLQALEAPWPAAAPAEPAAGSLPDLHCQHQTGTVYRGAYRRVLIQACTGVQLEDLQAQELRVEDSLVSLARVRIQAPRGAALHSLRSVLTATASQLSGEWAIRADDSRLDLAGVQLQGEQTAVQVDGRSRLLLSISRLESPQYRGYAHGLYRFRQRSLDGLLAPIR